MERKTFEKKMKVFTLLLAVFFLAILGRLGYLQLVQAEKYKTLATMNHVRLIPAQAPRGEIFDRNGTKIVGSRPVYVVNVTDQELKGNSFVLNLGRAGDWNDSRLETLAGTIWQDDAYFGDSQIADEASIKQSIDQVRKDLIKKREDKKNADNFSIVLLSPETLDKLKQVEPYLPAIAIESRTDAVSNMVQIILQDENYIGKTTFSELQREFRKRKKEAKPHEYVQLAKDVTYETVVKVTERQLDFPGISIDVEPVRFYPYNNLMPQVLGYVREIRQEQLEAKKDQGYRMGDLYGQVGLENIYEEYLKGTRGAREVEVDAQGRPVRELGVREPVPGNNLKLTVDYKLQMVAQEGLKKSVERAKQLGYTKGAGSRPINAAAVVQDVNTGAILAMASLPDYDLNLFSGQLSGATYNELASSKALVNHAIQTTYVPGSTFKMVVATALLEKGVADKSSSISDPGYYKHKRDWKPGGHGSAINIVKALKYSCDTYFYIFGAKLGPQSMEEYAKQYGLGQLTGIDLPGEEAGLIASPERDYKIWHENPNYPQSVTDWEEKWIEDDSMSMSIGQQESKFTALQLVNYVSAVANGGTLYRPQLVEKIVSPEGKLLQKYYPEIIRKVQASPETLEIVREGMHEVAINGGTGAFVFAGAPYTLAAKTGTAEAGGGNHGLFVAFAPYEKPEVSVAVIIEYGGTGSGVAGPAARQILDAYFANKSPGGSPAVN